MYNRKPKKKKKKPPFKTRKSKDIFRSRTSNLDKSFKNPKKTTLPEINPKDKLFLTSDNTRLIKKTENKTKLPRKKEKKLPKTKRTNKIGDYFKKPYEYRSTIAVVIGIVLILSCGILISQITYQTSQFSESSSSLSETLNEYIYNEYVLPGERMEHLTASENNITTITDDIPTEHYKGVESFFNNTIGQNPDEWLTVIEGNSEVSEKGPDGVRQKVNKVWAVYFQSRSITEHQFGAIYNYGIIEFWWRLGPPFPLLQIGTPWSRIKFMKAGTVVFQVMQYNRYFGMCNATGDSVAENTHGGNTIRLNWYQWYRIKIEFRLGGAPPFKNLNTNTYSIYVDDNLLEGNASDINHRTGISYWERWINTGTEQYDAWGEVFETDYFPRELDGVNYTESDNKETWMAKEKQIDANFTFNKDYLNNKNISYYFDFNTNLTLTPYNSGTQFGIYNYMDSTWEIITPISGSFSVFETKWFPSMDFLSFFNNDETIVSLRLITQNVHYEYDFNITNNCTAYFWIGG